MDGLMMLSSSSLAERRSSRTGRSGRANRASPVTGAASAAIRTGSSFLSQRKVVRAVTAGYAERPDSLRMLPLPLLRDAPARPRGDTASRWERYPVRVRVRARARQRLPTTSLTTTMLPTLQNTLQLELVSMETSVSAVAAAAELVANVGRTATSRRFDPRAPTRAIALEATLKDLMVVSTVDSLSYLSRPFLA